MKQLQGQWPLIVFALMFLVVPLSTLGNGWFEPIFVVLGFFTVIIAVLLVVSIVTSKNRQNTEN
jgi:lipopolysaccharide export LptBFGC system permease protein LptF